MAKISVIVPVYNVQNYLNKCLDSIVGQSFRDIEIICINDGSKDSSLQILEQYASRDNRIVVLTQRNNGLSAARNAGLDIATAEWISFVDSDDWLESDTFEQLTQILDRNIDIVCFGTHISWQGEVIPEIADSDSDYYRIKHKGLITLTDETRNTTDVSVWNKLFRKSIIDKYHLRFPIGRHYEDYVFYWKYMFVSSTAFYVEEEFYNYLRRPGSVMANTFNKQSKKVIDHLYAAEIIFNFLQNEGLLGSYLKVFAEIFMNCFWFAYNYSPKSRQKMVLRTATSLLNSFSLGDEFNDKWNNIAFLKAGQYHRIEALDYDDNVWHRLFSIKNGKGQRTVKFLYWEFSFEYKKELAELDDRLTNLEQAMNTQKQNLDHLTDSLQQQREYNQKQFGYFQNIEYETLNFIWRTHGVTGELMRRFELLRRSNYQWNIQTNHLWLVYLSCLIESGNLDQVSAVLQKYVGRHSFLDIERYLLVADYAFKQGYADSVIERASLVLNKLQEGRKQRRIEALFAGKTVAIVGNGPSECGKNKGPEIDSHDIVVRINNYQIAGFEKDYGTKTDVWVKCFSDDIKHDVLDSNIRLIVYETDFLHHPIDKTYFKPILEDTVAVDYFGLVEHVHLRNKLDVFPTTGLVVIEKALHCDVKQLDCYGFSFLQDAQNESAQMHYYQDADEAEVRRRCAHHSFQKESEYLKEVWRARSDTVSRLA